MRTILYGSPFNHSVSGADESLLTLLKFLSKEHWRPVVVTPWRSAYAEKYRALGAQVIRFPMLRIIRTFNPLYWILFLVWFPIEVGLFVFSILRVHADIVHSNMDSLISPLVAARIIGVPAVLHYRAKTVDEPKWFFDRFLPLLVALSHRIVAISRATARPFFKRDLGAKVQVCYNGLDLGRFRNVSNTRLIELFPELSKRRIVLFVGRLDPQKRLEDLIQAAHEIVSVRKDITFVIAGGDPNVSLETDHKLHLEQEIARLGLGAHFLFLGRRSDVPDLLASSHCFVFPAENEGFGRAVIEAMASGIPVIAANSGGPPELLEDGKLGFLVPPRDPAALASGILRALESKEARKVALAAKESAFKKFSAEQHANQITAVYQDMLGAGHPLHEKVT